MTTTVTILAYVALGLLALDAIFAWAFVARYARVRWYESAEGRHLMRFTTVLALMFTFTLFGQLVPTNPLTSVVLSILLFGWAAVELGIRVWLERRNQREGRQKADAAAAATVTTQRETERDHARDALRDGPRDEARDIAHDDERRRT